MTKIPRSDPRAAHMSSDQVVDRAGLAEHLADRHHWVLATTRSDGPATTQIPLARCRSAASRISAGFGRTR